MAQLRDKQTSECIAEGTPLEIVLLADKIGRDEFIFDDVGEGFDPEEVLSQHKAQVEFAKSTDDVSDEDTKAAVARGQLKRGAQKAATDALTAARARVKE